MGRKKCDITYIEDEKSRRLTYKIRVGGIIKKLHDLTKLCKVDASVVLTDLDGNLVTYSNTNQLQLFVSDNLNRIKDDFEVTVFTEDDVTIFCPLIILIDIISILL